MVMSLWPTFFGPHRRPRRQKFEANATVLEAEAMYTALRFSRLRRSTCDPQCSSGVDAHDYAYRDDTSELLNIVTRRVVGRYFCAPR